MKPLQFSLLIISSLIGLAACGNKGPLYLPEPAAQPQNTVPTATQPTTQPVSEDSSDATGSGT